MVLAWATAFVMHAQPLKWQVAQYFESIIVLCINFCKLCSELRGIDEEVQIWRGEPMGRNTECIRVSPRKFLSTSRFWMLSLSFRLAPMDDMMAASEICFKGHAKRL
jgi:hypothetical protein